MQGFSTASLNLNTSIFMHISVEIGHLPGTDIPISIDTNCSNETQEMFKRFVTGLEARQSPEEGK